jgi:hypothetical protein
MTTEYQALFLCSGQLSISEQKKAQEDSAFLFPLIIQRETNSAFGDSGLGSWDSQETNATVSCTQVENVRFSNTYSYEIESQTKRITIRNGKEIKELLQLKAAQQQNSTLKLNNRSDFPSDAPRSTRRLASSEERAYLVFSAARLHAPSRSSSTLEARFGRIYWDTHSTKRVIPQIECARDDFISHLLPRLASKSLMPRAPPQHVSETTLPHSTCMEYAVLVPVFATHADVIELCEVRFRMALG